jgi:predicted RNA-binding Zn-ribbon protein involved in translation (DUF1610 family)
MAKTQKTTMPCPNCGDASRRNQRPLNDEDRQTQCRKCGMVYRTDDEPVVATHDAGQGRRVTVPENPKPEDLLMDAIRENFSPEAVAAMAAYLQAANTKNRRVNEQLTWFSEKLIAEVGFAGYDHLLKEVGL